jgi:hypothetical protein
MGCNYAPHMPPNKAHKATTPIPMQPHVIPRLLVVSPHAYCFQVAPGMPENWHMI